MNDPSPRTRGFCPGVWQPMEAGDGWLVRVRPPHGQMAAHRLSALAALARKSGNGIIELTRRGNLQLRGVSEACLPRVQAELTELELADPHLALERRPQLIVSSLSGLDPRCPPLSLLASAIDAVLAEAARAQSFAAKFAIVLSGGDLSSAAIDADVHIRVHAHTPHQALLSLSGATEPARSTVVVPSESVPFAIRSLLAKSAQAGGARLRDLAHGEAVELLQSELAELGAVPCPAPALWAPPAPGLHAAGGARWATLKVPFGSALAGTWSALAGMAERWGSGELRFGSAREVVLPGVEASAREALGALAQRHGLWLDQPRSALELIACSGAPACRSAHGETRRLADELGELMLGRLGPAATLHVSGCDKGCASRRAAAVTVLCSSGGYQLGLGATVAQTARERVRSLAGLRSELMGLAADAGPPS